MPMEEALLARLRGATAIAAIVGDYVDWFDRARGSDQALRLTLVDPGEEWTHNGPDGLDDARVRIEAWARDKDTLMALKRAVRAEMRQPRDVGGWRFHEAELALERSDTDEDNTDDGDSDVLFRVTMDFEFFHEELGT